MGPSWNKPITPALDRDGHVVRLVPLQQNTPLLMKRAPSVEKVLANGYLGALAFGTVYYLVVASPLIFISADTGILAKNVH